MTKNAIRTFTTLATLGVLATACAASTDASTESTSSTSSADTTGCQNNSPNVDNLYDDMSQCYDLTGDNTVYASSYSGDSCNSFTAEWDGTDANTGEAFTVVVSPDATLTSTSCPETEISFTVYGLEVTVNEASHTDTVDWIPITTANVSGTWTNGYCAFDPNSAGVSRSFSAAIAGAGPTTVPVYLDLKVVGQVTQLVRLIKLEEGAKKETASPEGIPIFPLVSYLPFSAHIEKQGCD